MNLSTTSLIAGDAKNNPGQKILWGLCLVTCSYFALFFLYAVFTNYWPGPFVDYWIDIPNIEKFFNNTLTFHDLVSAHANVHRLFIPRLLFIADYRFFAGTNTLLIWVSILCKIATLWLFNHIIQDQALHKRLLLNMFLFAAILNVANTSNVLHNSNMQWDLVSVFSCFAIYFYSQNLQDSMSPLSAKRAQSIGLAVLFFTSGFLSQAGALPVVFVFVMISLLNKKWLEVILSLAFLALILYLTFAVLPVNEPDKPTYENALAIFIFKFKYVAIYVFKMFSGTTYFVDGEYFVFSWIMLGFLVFSLANAHKTRNIYNNVFLSIAMFAFLMMVTIAAARVDFSPRTWPANRYQTNTLIFILSLCLHGYFSADTWLRPRYAHVIRKFILALGFISFIIPQYYLNNYAPIFGNKIFDAQAYMLTRGVNQSNGASLLPSMQAYDRIAGPDPLFRQHGFAWYDNKQAGNDFYQHSKNTGEVFLTEANTVAFHASCSINPEPTQYNPVNNGVGLGFSTPINTAHHSFLSTVFHRNTYYVLDSHDYVIGFATILIDPDHQYTRATLAGYVTAPSAQYIAEVDKTGQPLCLYALTNSNP